MLRFPASAMPSVSAVHDSLVAAFDAVKHLYGDVVEAVSDHGSLRPDVRSGHRITAAVPSDQITVAGANLRYFHYS